MKGIACYGVHPWFLHEVLLNGGKRNENNGDYDDDEWLAGLRRHLINDPSAIVGEIGLDGARWRVVEMDDKVDDNGNENDELVATARYERSSYGKLADDARPGGMTTRDVGVGCNNNNNNNENDITINNYIWERKRILSCPMTLQKLAFEEQLLLATELNRPVSIHVVKAWGELLDSFITVQDIMRQWYDDNVHDAIEEVTEEMTVSQQRGNRRQQRQLLLPPKIYFHAFSGKSGILPSLLSICARANIPKSNVYFGFAPAITKSYYSNKTPTIMKAIGIDQLLLETDLEDSTNALDDLMTGAEGLATALDMTVEDVATATYQNAMRFYF
jgi:Tat protein secretion system quality control protein TatD with DNase activity